MRLVVGIAVLLSVGVLNTMSVKVDLFAAKKAADKPCSDGWIQFYDKRCVKYVTVAKTFLAAEAECHKAGADILFVRSPADLKHLLCLTMYSTTTAEPNAVWAGVFGGAILQKIAAADVVAKSKPPAGCSEVDARVSGEWAFVSCKKKNYFVCVKNPKVVVV